MALGRFFRVTMAQRKQCCGKRKQPGQRQAAQQCIRNSTQAIRGTMKSFCSAVRANSDNEHQCQGWAIISLNTPQGSPYHLQFPLHIYPRGFFFLPGQGTQSCLRSQIIFLLSSCQAISLGLGGRS